MIPKIIHYCCFGGKPLTEMAEKCIASWKKFAPDFEIIRWDESNFNVYALQYTREAYEAQKFAFVADVARLHALVNCGGIYMDTDVELIKPLDSLLEYEAVSGFETPTEIATGLMGCIPTFPLFKELLAEYDTARFLNDDGSLNMTTNVARITETLAKHGLVLNNTIQTVDGFTLLPQDYLSPFSYIYRDLNITKNTICIHWYAASWLPIQDRLVYVACEAYVKKFSNFVPRNIAKYMARLAAVIKIKGVRYALTKLYQKYI